MQDNKQLPGGSNTESAAVPRPDGQADAVQPTTQQQAASGSSRKKKRSEKRVGAERYGFAEIRRKQFRRNKFIAKRHCEAHPEKHFRRRQKDRQQRKRCNYRKIRRKQKGGRRCKRRLCGKNLSKKNCARQKESCQTLFAAGADSRYAEHKTDGYRKERGAHRAGKDR